MIRKFLSYNKSILTQPLLASKVQAVNSIFQHQELFNFATAKANQKKGKGPKSTPNAKATTPANPKANQTKAAKPPAKATKPPAKAAQPPAKATKPPAKATKPPAKAAQPPAKAAQSPAKTTKPPAKKKNQQPLIPPQDYIQKQLKFSTHNYHPLGVVIKSAKGLYMTDVQNKRYMDFLAAYSAVNQGHAHPKILSAFRSQLGKVTLTSRAFHSDQLGMTCQFLSKHFKYDKVLMMNSGVEAVESSIKIARKWAYQVKGVPIDEARVIFATGNFMGRTIALIGASQQVQRNHNFGPFGGLKFDLVQYNNIQALTKMIEKSAKSAKNTAAVFLQPIQGQAGVIIPDKGYIKQVSQLCKKHNILFIGDEIQTGLGRTGKWTACQWDKVKPDIITLGKALGGGVYPVSAVLGSKQVMDVLTPGTHGSTFGGNPLACAVARASIEVLRDQKLIQNSANLGKTMTRLLNELSSPLIQNVRNRGLMGALEIKKGIEGASAWDLCQLMKQNGVLAKPTHQNIIRLTPPLIIKQEQLQRAFQKIKKSLKKLQKTAKYTQVLQDDQEHEGGQQQELDQEGGEEQAAEEEQVADQEQAAEEEQAADEEQAAEEEQEENSQEQEQQQQ